MSPRLRLWNRAPRSAQGFKGGKSQKLTKKQKRMEAMQKNKSPGVRDECVGVLLIVLLTVCILA
jgi:hypothetical protein